MTYSEKLKDPRWQKVRLIVLERDGWACVDCGSKTNTLHVHHGYYSKGEPWDAPIDTLWCLCEGCHELNQDTLSDLKLELGRTNPRDYGAIFDGILQARENAEAAPDLVIARGDDA